MRHNLVTIYVDVQTAQPLGGPPRSGTGSTGRPHRQTSKCRWGPVTLPVDPLSPITWRASTRCWAEAKENAGATFYFTIPDKHKKEFITANIEAGS